MRWWLPFIGLLSDSTSSTGTIPGLSGHRRTLPEAFGIPGTDADARSYRRTRTDWEGRAVVCDKIVERFDLFNPSMMKEIDGMQHIRGTVLDVLMELEQMFDEVHNEAA